MLIMIYLFHAVLRTWRFVIAVVAAQKSSLSVADSVSQGDLMSDLIGRKMEKSVVMQAYRTSET